MSSSCKAIPIGKLIEVLEARRLAPSGADRQPWMFIVVDDPEIKRRIRKVCESLDKEWWKKSPRWFLRWARSVGLSKRKSFLEEVPFLICVFYDSTKPYSLESAWVSIAFMILQTTELGLATLTYAPTDSPVLKKALKVPRHYTLAAILPIGEARRDLSFGRRRKKSLEKIVFHSRYGGRMSSFCWVMRSRKCFTARSAL